MSILICGDSLQTRLPFLIARGLGGNGKLTIRGEGSSGWCTIVLPGFMMAARIR